MALSAAEENVSQGYTRYQRFWLEDGNIILVASDSTGFRVHRSVLAMKSSVFQDMLSFPQPDASELSTQTTDCPVIHLQDSSDDLAYFFDAMYNGMRYRFDKELKPTWDAVRALLLLGNKYDVEELHKEGLRCLKQQFPDTIEEWDAVYDESWFILGKRDVLSIEIANVCRFLRLPEFHIPALYLCCTLPGKTLKQGAVLREGEDAKVQLNPEDLAICLAARKGLRELLEGNLAELIDQIPSEEGALCSGNDACDTVIRDLQGSLDWPRVGSRPYSVLDSFWWVFDSLDDICNNCVEYFQNQHLEDRQLIRDRLHTYIVVPLY